MYLSAEKIDQKSWRMSDETLMLYSSAETYFILTDQCWNFIFWRLSAETLRYWHYQYGTQITQLTSGRGGVELGRKDRGVEIGNNPYFIYYGWWCYKCAKKEVLDLCWQHYRKECHHLARIYNGLGKSWENYRSENPPSVRIDLEKAKLSMR